MKRRRFTHFLIKKIGKRNARYVFDFRAYLTGFLVATFIGFLLSVYLNKTLIPEEMGRFSYLRSLSDMLFVLFTFNLYSNYLRFNINGVNKKLYNIIKKINIIAFILSASIIFYVSKSPLAPLYAFFIVYQERMYLFRSTMKMGALNIVRIVTIVTTLLLTILLGQFGLLDANVVLASYGFGYLITFFIPKNIKYEQGSERTPTKSIMKFALPLYATTLLTAFQTYITQFLLKSRYDYETLANFAVAQRSLLILSVFTSMLIMFYPSIYYREIQIKHISVINKIRFSITVTVLILTLLFVFFREYVYQFMGASAYLKTVNIFMILIIAQTIMVITNFWSNFISYSLKTYITMVVSAITVLINISLVFILTRYWGLVGAAYAILIANSFYCIAMTYIALRDERHYLLSNNTIEIKK